MLAAENIKRVIEQVAGETAPSTRDIVYEGHRRLPRNGRPRCAHLRQPRPAPQAAVRSCVASSPHDGREPTTPPRRGGVADTESDPLPAAGRVPEQRRRHLNDGRDRWRRRRQNSVAHETPMTTYPRRVTANPDLAGRYLVTLAAYRVNFGIDLGTAMTGYGITSTGNIDYGCMEILTAAAGNSPCHEGSSRNIQAVGAERPSPERGYRRRYGGLAAHMPACLRVQPSVTGVRQTHGAELAWPSRQQR